MVSENGNTYVVWDAHYKDISQKVKALMDSGYKCCLFTKDKPGSLADLHQNLKIIRVSEDEAEDTLPLTFEHVMGKFEDFVAANKENSVVVLDVFDNLLDSGVIDFPTAYLLLNRMLDMTVINNNILFVPISSKSLDEREKTLIQQSGVNVMSATDEKPPRLWFFRKKGTNDG